MPQFDFLVGLEINSVFARIRVRQADEGFKGMVSQWSPASPLPDFCFIL
jgi:hypothetical protein